MNAAEITALATGLPAIIGAITALVTAIRAGSRSKVAAGIAVHTHDEILSHVVNEHNAFPIQPPTETEHPLQ